ncbi:snare YKT6 [Pyrrhoderma noxium]|uniref:Synaptobrevin homolog YKT6 n=1 Tax=Pyrrhoderma noxium TaxID=2282107 RepID=A0A286UDW6_9AGAM|nr:snare YKT6 [Pyrrhoderma noxium]
MKIYALSIVLTPEGGSAKVLNSASDLSSFSFYQRGTISEFLTFFSGLVAERTQPGERQSFTDVDKQDSEYVFHVYNRGGDERLAAVMVSDKEYPRRPAFSVLTKSIETFSNKVPTSSFSNPSSIDFPDLKEFLANYQDPRNADSIMKLQQELDETKIVMHQTIESVLKRGEKLEDLVARSDALGAQSKRFYVTAKKQNSCCVVM